MRAGNTGAVIVTGGAGFIGSHTAERFLQLGYAVSIVDNLSAGSERNVPHGARLYTMDILDDRMSHLIDTIRPLIVIHCAAQVSVPVSMADPAHDLQVNLVGTAQLISACQQAGVKRFIFLSSGGAIYGETSTPADEATAPRPTSYYGVHKLAAEHHVSLSGLSYAILRPSNVYGPRQRHDQEGGVVSVLARQGVSGGPLTIAGDGNQTRDFVHVHDVAEAIVRASSTDNNGIWNVSTGTSTSINELAGHLEILLGRRIPREYIPSRAGDVYTSCLNNRRIQHEVGWVARTTLDIGLQSQLAEIELQDNLPLAYVHP